MKKIGTSSIWYEKYRPQTFEDVITTPAMARYLERVKTDDTVGNLLFNGRAGTGKSSIAYAIVRELGADELYVNASSDTSIDNIRFNVRSFATTKSLMSDGEKIVILDEFDRLSAEAMDSLKAMIEETHRNCRYIFITNNIGRVIEPLISRAEQFTFGNETGEEKKDLIIKLFGRMKFILDTEEVEYDGKVVATVVRDLFPDFRKTINKLQNYFKLYGQIDKGIFNTLDDVLIKNLVDEMKSMNFNSVQLLARGIDPNGFYTTFYADLKEYLENESIPDMIMLMNEYNYRNQIVIDREINLVACLSEMMQTAKWK